MTETYTDLRARLLTAIDTLATKEQLRRLREEVELAVGEVTPDHLAELEELIAEAECKSNAAAVGEQKARHDL